MRAFCCGSGQPGGLWCTTDSSGVDDLYSPHSCLHCCLCSQWLRILHGMWFLCAYGRFVGDERFESVPGAQISLMGHTWSQPFVRKEWGESEFNAALLHLTFIVFVIIRIRTLTGTDWGFNRSVTVTVRDLHSNFSPLVCWILESSCCI